jgi:hypothetical protein
VLSTGVSMKNVREVVLVTATTLEHMLGAGHCSQPITCENNVRVGLLLFLFW